jgi:cytochrome c oxidase assembly factor CtaG
MNLWDSYPLSAHIVQHFVLGLVLPPVLLLGAPTRFVAAAMKGSPGRPPISWLIGVGTMLAWHIPALFNAALANQGLHVFQLLSFLISGAIFWWPIFSPLENRRLSPLAAVSYLFSACICCSLLGAFLTFGPLGLYAVHAHAQLDPKSDQQLAGVFMWVPGCFVYLSGILVTVMRWYGETSQHEA